MGTQSNFPSRHIDGPGSRNCLEPLPAYRQVLFKSGALQLKKEMSTPLKESGNRKWVPCHVSINGTQLILISGKVLASTNILSLQFAQVGMASDYKKADHCFRIRAEGQQYLFAAASLKEMLEWILALQISIDLSLPIDLRQMPEMPRRRGPTSLLVGPMRCSPQLAKWAAPQVASATGGEQSSKEPRGSKGCPPTVRDFKTLRSHDPWAGLIFYNGKFASVEHSYILPMTS